MVKRLPAMWETWIRSLGREDPPWRRKWQPIPVFLLEKFHGQRRLVGYSPWGSKELDVTDQLSIRYKTMYTTYVGENEYYLKW